MKDWRAKTIEGHAFLSDGETAALVYEDGTIDWLCMPRFDSPACLASIVGDGDNGGWWLQPAGSVKHRQRRYVEDTLVLETLIQTDTGEVSVTDFMPMKRGQAPDIVRIIEGRSGSVEMISRLAMRFDNGRTHPHIEATSEREIHAIAGPNAAILRSSVPFKVGSRVLEAAFTVNAGERQELTLTWYRSYDEAPDPVDPAKALEETTHYWTRWSKKGSFKGFSQSTVARSLLTLKGLVHDRTGGIVAAPTASLPEHPGGSLNWDYRYCWLRDATFTLIAFMHTGHKKEARRWIEWLSRALSGEPIAIQPFYRIDGERHLLEWKADWLSGFEQSQPVRLGNGAIGQVQLDIYGEVIDAVFVARKNGLLQDEVHIVRLLAEELESQWTKPDAGIWENRGDPKHHVYSKAMCWVAFDRASLIAEETTGQEHLARRWRQLADEVRRDVLENGFSTSVGAFTRAYGEDTLDASVLRLPTVGFIKADDQRMISTVAAIEKDLCRNGYVYRYSTDFDGQDGQPKEGAFIAVGCWLADVYAMQGRLDEAKQLFASLEATANDLGLMSEEFDPVQRRSLGNFPQALSHVALVNSALIIDNDGRCPRLIGTGLS